MMYLGISPVNAAVAIRGASEGLLHNLLIKRLHVIEWEKSIRQWYDLMCSWFSQHTSAFVFFFSICSSFFILQGENTNFHHSRKTKPDEKAVELLRFLQQIHDPRDYYWPDFLTLAIKNAVTMKPMNPSIVVNLCSNFTKQPHVFWSSTNGLLCVSALLVVCKLF